MAGEDVEMVEDLLSGVENEATEDLFFGVAMARPTLVSPLKRLWWDALPPAGPLSLAEEEEEEEEPR